MIDRDVTNHLEKYFKLSRGLFSEGDYALAAFFAVTTIEEAAKLMIMEGQSFDKRNRKELLKDAHNHRAKYFSALINLIDQSPQYETLPGRFQKEIESWWDTDRLMKIRNDCLYLSDDRDNKITTPEKSIDSALAALLVYIAGVVLAGLDEYVVGMPSNLKKHILESVDTFRRKYLYK